VEGERIKEGGWSGKRLDKSRGREGRK